MHISLCFGDFMHVLSLCTCRIIPTLHRRNGLTNTRICYFGWVCNMKWRRWTKFSCQGKRLWHSFCFLLLRGRGIWPDMPPWMHLSKQCQDWSRRGGKTLRVVETLFWKRRQEQSVPSSVPKGRSMVTCSPAYSGGRLQLAAVSLDQLQVFWPKFTLSVLLTYLLTCWLFLFCWIWTCSQCPGRFLSIISPDPSVFKFNWSYLVVLLY